MLNATIVVKKNTYISTVCCTKVKSKPNVYVNRPTIKRIDESEVELESQATARSDE